MVCWAYEWGNNGVCIVDNGGQFGNCHLNIKCIPVSFWDFFSEFIFRYLLQNLASNSTIVFSLLRIKSVIVKSPFTLCSRNNSSGFPFTRFNSLCVRLSLISASNSFQFVTAPKYSGGWTGRTFGLYDTLVSITSPSNNVSVIITLQCREKMLLSLIVKIK